MSQKSYRLNEFINATSGHSLIIDTSRGLVLGPLPGLEHFSEAMTPLLPLVDGVVISPGQARKLSGRTRQEAALLARSDWTNALRKSDFVIPVETIGHISLLTPREVLDLGASALVLYFLLGYEEEIEAGCVHRTVQSALDGARDGVPLIVDVLPVGPRVVLHKKAVELGVSYALEGGADGVAVPWPGQKSFETIIKMSAEVPVWVKPTALGDTAAELSQSLELGGTGLWLDEQVFALPDPAKFVKKFGAMVHETLPVV